MPVFRHVLIVPTGAKGSLYGEAMPSALCDSVRVILSCGSLSCAIYANADDAKINSKTAYVVYLAHKIG